MHVLVVRISSTPRVPTHAHQPEFRGHSKTETDQGGFGLTTKDLPAGNVLGPSGFITGEGTITPSASHHGDRSTSPHIHHYSATCPLHRSDGGSPRGTCSPTRIRHPPTEGSPTRIRLTAHTAPPPQPSPSPSQPAHLPPPSTYPGKVSRTGWHPPGSANERRGSTAHDPKPPIRGGSEPQRPSPPAVP